VFWLRIDLTVLELKEIRRVLLEKSIDSPTYISPTQDQTASPSGRLKRKPLAQPNLNVLLQKIDTALAAFENGDS
jgi:hypothetical protein